MSYALESTCCDAVVDPISLLVTIGGIAALSIFLRQAVIDFNIMAGKRRKRNLEFLSKGTYTTVLQI